MDIFVDNDEYKTIRQKEIDKARHVVTTGRGLSDYEERLLFNRDDLSRKKILDLGSGVAKFPEELCEYFSDPNQRPHISALDIAYDFQTHGAGKALLERKIDVLKEKYPQNISFVSGLFSNLPFDDGQFDFVFSLYAFPLHIREEKYFEKGLHEIVRVLKSGGVAKMAPLEYNSGRVEGKATETYVTYFYNPDHFESIFERIEKRYYGRIRLNTFKSNNVAGLGMQKM